MGKYSGPMTSPHVEPAATPPSSVLIHWVTELLERSPRNFVIALQAPFALTFFMVSFAIAVGALVGRIIEGKLDPNALVDAFRGKRSSS